MFKYHHKCVPYSFASTRREICPLTDLAPEVRPLLDRGTGLENERSSRETYVRNHTYNNCHTVSKSDTTDSCP
jgi:hypothetical protein